MADYDLVPVEGNPFDQTAAQPSYDLVPVQGNPFDAAGNTRTGFAKGVGSLAASGMGMAMPDLMMASSITGQPVPDMGEVGKAAENFALGGKTPYQPTTGLGRIYQNTIANATAGAAMLPLAVAGGIPGLLTSVAGDIGSAAGQEALPNHPVIGGLLGSLAGGGAVPAAAGAAKATWNTANRALGTGRAVEQEALSQFAQQPATRMPMSEIDNTLATQGDPYWTPGRINAASEFNKRQAVAKILPPSVVPSNPTVPDWLLRPATIVAGGGAGAGVGHLVSHLTGLPAGITDFVLGGLGEEITRRTGLGLGSNSANFNQRVLDALKNNPTQLYQQYQQLQQQPAALPRYATGLISPLIASTMGQ